MKGERMKGLVIREPGLVELASDIPMPEIDEYQALCRNVGCGICNGTDLKLIDGSLRGMGAYPNVFGHEAVGEVIAVGGKVRNFKIGDYVLRSCLPDMPGLAGRWGGFAQFGIVDDYCARIEDGVEADDGFRTRQVIPPGIDPIDATMIITLKEVAAALVRLDLKPGMDVVVVGCGPVGLAMLSMCRCMGAGRLALAGHHEERLQTALRLGADRVVNTRNTDLAAFCRKAFPNGVDMLIDCVGRVEVINQAMQIMKEEGKIALYGIGMHNGDCINWEDAPYNFNIHSVQWPIAKYEQQVHDFVCEKVLSGEVNLKEFVSHVLPVEQYEEGLALVRSRKGKKVVLSF